jgi:hypothetical protein
LTEQPAGQIAQPTWSPPVTHFQRVLWLFGLCGSYAFLEVPRMRPHGIDCSFQALARLAC